MPSSSPRLAGRGTGAVGRCATSRPGELAQLVLTYPFTIFLAQLLGCPWNEGGVESLLSRVFGLARAAADTFGLTAFIPTWLADAFASPVALMLVTLAVACAQPPYPSRPFLVGLGCMVAGMGLQYADVTDITATARFSTGSATSPTRQPGGRCGI
jgi:hypothetical protein